MYACKQESGLECNPLSGFPLHGNPPEFLLIHSTGMRTNNGKLPTSWNPNLR